MTDTPPLASSGAAATHLVEAAEDAIEIVALTKEGLTAWLDTATAAERTWVAALGFKAEAGKTATVPDEAGGIARVLLGVEGPEDLWSWAGLPSALPDGVYGLAPDTAGARP
jgi:leucyl aminopeptidase